MSGRIFLIILEKRERFPGIRPMLTFDLIVSLRTVLAPVGDSFS